VFGPNIFFEQVTNSFEVEGQFLNLPFNENTTTEQLVINIYHQEAESIVNSITYSDCLESQLRMYLFTKLSEEYVSTDHVAKVFNMSESTLKRKLKALGTSFSILRDEVMLHLAKKLLTETNMTIQQIAYNVGYSEHSAFNHAFTRLTTYTPSKYRNEHLTSRDVNKGCINA
jgi:AraC-like DNA-binding protein